MAPPVVVDGGGGGAPANVSGVVVPNQGNSPHTAPQYTATNAPPGGSPTFPRPWTFGFTVSGTGLTRMFQTTDDPGHNTNWWFGDGTTTRTGSTQPVPHTYSTAGTYVVQACCHGETARQTLTVQAAAGPPVLTSIAPSAVTVGQQVTLTLTGTGFAAPMLTRFWSASVFQVATNATVSSTTKATVNIDTTGWPPGTGGVDVVVADVFSNQLQFPVNA